MRIIISVSCKNEIDPSTGLLCFLWPYHNHGVECNYLTYQQPNRVINIARMLSLYISYLRDIGNDPESAQIQVHTSCQF